MAVDTTMIDIALEPTDPKATLCSQTKDMVKTKPKRTRISAAVKSVLNDHFRKNPYPDDREIASLLEATKLTGRTIKTWFTNTRSRNRGTGEEVSANWTFPSPPVDQNSSSGLDDAEGTFQTRSNTRRITRASLEALNRTSPTTSVNSLDRYLATFDTQEYLNTARTGSSAQTPVPKRLCLLPNKLESNSDALFTHQRSSRKPSSTTPPSSYPSKRDTRKARRARSVTRSESSFGSVNSVGSCTSVGSVRSVDSRGARRGRKQWVRQNTNRTGSRTKVLTRPESPKNTSSRFNAPQVDLSSTPKRRLFCTWPDCSESFRYRSEWARHEEAIHYLPYRWNASTMLRL
ncbi:hypothetical protein BDW02DRAFT_580778 [Decorospora gaudefroyi]|uniref:Homeobox domain-containing protein n=1 Tax=Decorospora gaudefroyi TaxID=184978 RepID=A0A6A5K9N2_9PLEO|nr:hypothetical protein BDW02DRAFT_580778 [Decorospora gaudefroyi]